MTALPNKHTTMDSELLERFDRRILELNSGDDTYRQSLAIDSSQQLAEVFAPFGHIQTTASIAVVGLTPGDHQARVALQAYVTARRRGEDTLSANAHAKHEASFSGGIRNNLVRILDHAGFNQHLKIDTTASLFDKDRHLVHFTSLLRYPIFASGENYAGTPKPTKSDFLWTKVKTRFVEEYNRLDGIRIWIPLGAAVQEAFRRLIAEGLVQQDHVRFDLPHPSGANMGRIKQFLDSTADIPNRSNAPADRKDPSMPTSSNPIPAASNLAEKPLIGLVQTVRGRTFISQTVENRIRDLSTAAGLEAQAIKGDTSKTRAISNRGDSPTDTLYYSRETGISRGMLQIVVHPKLGVHLDKLALEHPAISAHINRKDKSEPRLIFSSNYAAFQNKGMSDTRHEHCGWAYQIDINRDMGGIEHFLTQFRKLTLSRSEETSTNRKPVTL